jgi:UDP-glucose 4-epimerase
MNVLVTGGAGYIGSHMIKYLVQKNCTVTVIDNLSTGNRNAVKSSNFIQGDLADQELLEEVFSKARYDAVFHFAAFSQVGESVRNPLKYFRNNISNTINLLNVMDEANVHHLVYSSSAAVYGNPVKDSISESDPLNPVNPYGLSKLVVEKIIEDWSSVCAVRAACFRYFNAAGADLDGELGESHDPETHLIPLILRVASGRMRKITIFGDNYETPDGTCVRDYIHVWDLCEAHWLGLQRIMTGAKNCTYNLGNGTGFSIREVIECAQKVTGQKIEEVVSERRAGDPARLVANASLAIKELNWMPKHSMLQQILKDAWAWEKKQTFLI